ncbi:hypothetical protein L0U85_12220 [Glycomyces sp. L485]|uniref:hypothetical protein n=1 Tax=Glycomyces sp. L485 TaxID=2909235 RepID=UPI001F4A10D0|nr:hypothetical protein [Glycomyces sp. L485]MCH7231610.1 hypothetical protein [Glycomyces sp. L485]
MSRPDQLFPYPRERVVDNARHEMGLMPTRIVACLLPLWRIEVEATVTEGRPYELLDRFLEAAIADAGFDTVRELALFLSLDETLVDRVLRFLARTGHLVESGGHYSLTALGRRSVENGKRFEVIKADRRVLYFEALGSQPLTRIYYDSKTVTILGEFDAVRLLGQKSGVRFRRIGVPIGRAANALQDLMNRRDRDRFNLPEGIEDLRPLGSDRPAYLPVYLVRAEPSAGPARYLAYTQASAGHDPELSEVFEQHPYVRAHMEQLETEGLGGGDEQNIAAWAEFKDLGQRPDVRQVDRTWRVLLPEREFTREGGLTISQIGQYKVSRNTVFQLWCASAHARTRALLDRAAGYLGAARNPEPDLVEARLHQFARQLEFEPMSLDSLAALAANAGNHHLAGQLEELT